MLTPQYLARAPDRIVNLYQKLEDFIIADLVRRLTTSVGKVATQTALHQLQQAQSWGLNIDKIQAEVARITGRSEAEIMALFDDAMLEAVKYDNPIYEAAGMEPPDSESEQLDNFIKASRRRTGEELHNLTQSMGFAKQVGDRLIFQPIAQYYQNTLDFALMQAQSGELDVVSAIRKAVAEMAGGGLRVVDYASGHTNRMDVAVRRAVLSGIKDTAREISRMRGEEMGVTIWEISAHSGARPTHQKWQGKRFDTTGTYYPTEQELTHGELNDYG